jgi:tRNA modification GTPase
MMHGSFSDSIYAKASGAGRAALTVVRASGPACATALGILCGGLPPPRRASLRRLRDRLGETLDQAIVLWFPGPASYSGEDGFELHLHGGPAILDGVGEALEYLGLRLAEPGEFTRRAVMNGRMDLLEAEAVADVIAAETAMQRKQALLQLGGALSAVYAGWRQGLLRLLAQQEALIDFPDEDLPPEVEAQLVADITQLHDSFRAHLREDTRGEALRTGLVFAIAGPPNVGKSTLINALCQREIAIVSPTAGTTRDVLEARIEIAGVPVTLLDTAGLRVSCDPIEAEGIRRARARMDEASLVIALHEAGSTDRISLADTTLPCLSVGTKADLVAGLPDAAQGDIDADIAISVRTGAGMNRLLARLADETHRLAGLTATPAVTRRRHRHALSQAADHLSAALEATWPELRGEELRLAIQALGRVTGEVGIEEVLDSVFGQFCIGK